MKKLVVLLIVSFTFVSCFKHLTPEDCVVKEVKINSIQKSTTNDIVFFDNKGDRFYIIKGIETGLNLDSLNAKVLNKTVTLHLPKALGGFAVSEHIAQIKVDDNIIFTEFKQ